MPFMQRTSFLTVGIACLFAGNTLAQEAVDYTKHVKPILTRHCLECHNAKKGKGGFRVDTVAEMMKGGDKGPAVVPGKVDKSLLLHMVNGQPGVSRMPYKRSPMSMKEIDLLTKWVAQGAKAPKDETAKAKHWAFQPVVRAPLPKVKNDSWTRNAIDHFILARLEKERITPSPEADKVTLIRRVYLDLIGLPPTVEEVDAFLKDTSPKAYEKVVDHLLASPHYGERWGRHWLDLARYADTQGFTIDAPREIWKYRDWVIDALNQDMPLNQFVIEQMAGDMLPGATLSQKIATGFHRNTLINEEGGIDQEQFRVDAVADRVNTTGTVFLGLTLGCARCHDHKYDPISTREYYQLFAFLNNQSEPKLNIADPDTAAKRDKIQAKMDKLEEEMDPKLKEVLQKQVSGKEKDNIAQILNLRPDQRTEAQKKSLAKYFRPKNGELKKQFDVFDGLKKQLPKFPTTMVLQELPKPRDSYIHIQGDFTRKGAKVSPGVLGILHPLPSKPGKLPNRLDLAHWLVDPANPLVGRVTVNRIWQGYFGAGLVETENDFGTQGAHPTHPELLDWLASELIQKGWSLKAMHRLIVTSATYRQSSKLRPDLAKIDPFNKLLARQSRLRLDAEIVRDCALSASGLLSKKIGGPSVFPPQPAGVYAFTQVKREWKVSTGEDRFRRGLYTFLQRSAPYPSLIVFDAPDGTSACTRRVRSNTPLQALTLLNDKAYLELARGLAYRTLKEAAPNDTARLEYVFRLCLVRQPSTWELSKLSQFFEQLVKHYQAAPAAAKDLISGEKDASFSLATANLPANIDPAHRAAWTSVARVLLNLDEFITRE